MTPDPQPISKNRVHDDGDDCCYIDIDFFAKSIIFSVSVRGINTGFFTFNVKSRKSQFPMIY